MYVHIAVSEKKVYIYTESLLTSLEKEVSVNGSYTYLVVYSVYPYIDTFVSIHQRILNRRTLPTGRSHIGSYNVV